jgi:LmbE family N-acetylglucosaminyl deacetylase
MNTDKHRSGLISTKLQASGLQLPTGNMLRKLSVFICVHLWIISLCFLGLPGRAVAQIRPVYDQGALGLGRLLKRLNTSASVMMIGAHPDDEDTALLSYLARGENARTAYLSLTRGDGGQNILGTELGETLGVIRTEELLQARKLDGAEQYFTRAYDYGFSKTLAEAKEKWDEKIVLCDAVRVIRHFRPLVVVSQFSGTPADGHGQHQYAGYISPLAVKAAANLTQCTDAGPAWGVKKFYARHRSVGEPRLRVNTGKYDPLLGRSYFEIAMEARSQHRSQEQGVLELKGEAFSALNLAESEAKEKGIFDSLDTSVRGVAKNTGENDPRFTELLTKLEDAGANALKQYEIQSPEKIVPLLAEGYRLAKDPEWTTRLPGPGAFLLQKRNEFLSALKLAAGIQVDAISDRETAVSGETLNVNARVFYPENAAIKVTSVHLRTPQGWTVTPTTQPTPQAGPGGRRENPNFGSAFAVKVSDSAPPTQPYWLEHARKGDLFNWEIGMERTFPVDRPEVTAEVTLTVNGTELLIEQPVEFRYADDIRGEIRRPLAVVPSLSISLEPELLMLARGSRAATKEISVTVTNNSSGPAAGKLRLDVRAGWSVSPQSPDFTLSRKGESASVKFLASVPANMQPGSYSIGASATSGGGTYARSMRTIAYPHIQTHRTYRDAVAKANVLDLKTPQVKVGYIPGSGDKMIEALAQMGIAAALIDEQTLASGDLSQFDVIIVGIRAYQVRPHLVANNKRLLDFANVGGTVIVQYQLADYARQNMTPYPAQQGPRVSDENAKMTILEPTHPIFNIPNKITDTDFEGWVQERNLYNFSTMDPKYIGLLESHDAGEAENKGGLVVADVGNGKYVYCSYSLFRQLPAGVPGAYRLLANMLSFRGVKGKKP